MVRCLFLVLLSLRAFAQGPAERVYRISVAIESEPVRAGTIWLYSYSWYGLQQLKLATIENGSTVVPLDTDKLRRGLNPHPNTAQYVIALQINEHLWYRTPNISPEIFWTRFPEALNALGQAESMADATRLILPPPVKRRITFLYPNGRPAANADLQVSEYLYDENHCGAHFGLPLGTYRTDKSGTIVVLAPLVALYLDDLTYLENGGSGPAGIAYSYNTGLKLGPEETLVLTKAWEFSNADYLSNEKYELRVLTAKGLPRRGVAVSLSISTNTCGSGQGEIGKTDRNGVARIELTPQIVSGLQLSQADGEMRDLTEDEMRVLFSQHKLTTRW